MKFNWNIKPYQNVRKPKKRNTKTSMEEFWFTKKLKLKPQKNRFSTGNEILKGYGYFETNEERKYM